MCGHGKPKWDDACVAEIENMMQFGAFIHARARGQTGRLGSLEAHRALVDSGRQTGRPLSFVTQTAKGKALSKLTLWGLSSTRCTGQGNANGHTAVWYGLDDFDVRCC